MKFYALGGAAVVLLALITPLRAATLEGQVLQNGEKTAGARLTYAGAPPLQFWHSDASGHFKIEGAPEAGVLTLWAAKDHSFGELKIVEGAARKNLEVLLQSSIVPAVQQVEPLLEKLFAGNSPRWAKSRVLNNLARHDPVLALKWAQQSDDAESIASVIGGALDNDKNLDWARQNIALIKDEKRRFYITGEVLARRMLETDPDWVKQWVLAERAQIKDDDFSEFAARRYWNLAGFAARLKMPNEAHQWLQLGQAAANFSLQGKARSELMVNYSDEIALGGVEMLEEFLQGEDASTQMTAYAHALPVLKNDLPGAKKLLEKIRALRQTPEVKAADAAPKKENEWRLDSQDILDGVLCQLAPLLAASEPEVALQMVRESSNLWFKFTGLEATGKALVAAGHKTQAAAALRAAAESAQDLGGIWTSGMLPRLAGLAASFDPALQAEIETRWRSAILKGSTLPRPPAPAEGGGQIISPWAMQTSVAPWAFLAAPDEPATSRLLLEWEWAGHPATATDNDYYKMTFIAAAMGTLDTSRAWEMAQSLPEDNVLRAAVVATTAEYSLASPQERRNVQLWGF
jgi:hypothetical protein